MNHVCECVCVCCTSLYVGGRLKKVYIRSYYIVKDFVFSCIWKALITIIIVEGYLMNPISSLCFFLILYNA